MSLSPDQLGHRIRDEVLQNCPDLQKIRNWIAAGANLEVYYNNGYGDLDRRTALFLAADAGHDDAVHLLIDAGADVNVEFWSGTPLTEAACNGHHNIIEALLAAEVDIHAAPCGWNALMHACDKGQKEAALLLLEKGADPFFTNDRKQSAHSLCRKRFPDIAKILKEEMRLKRLETSSALSARAFGIFSKHVLQTKQPLTVRKIKPRQP